MLCKLKLASFFLPVLTLAILAFAASPAFAEKIYFPGPSFGGSCVVTVLEHCEGKFDEPAGVAINDETKDVYVVDKGNKRVEEFTAEGTFIKEMTPPGGFEDPEEIAVDNSGDPMTGQGDVYVTDTGHKAIDKFSATGTYEGQLTEAEICEFNPNGVGGPGEPICEVVPFGSLMAVVVDSAGDLWISQDVVDRANHEPYSFVDEFNASGEFLRTFRTSFFEAGHALAVDSNENIYVGDGSGIIDVFTPEDYNVKPTHIKSDANSSYSFGSEGVAMAIIPATGVQLADDPLIDMGGSIGLYAPIAESDQKPLEFFPGESVPKGFPGFSESVGLAVNVSATVYASERTANKVQSFGYVPVPVVTTEAPSEVTETNLKFHGDVNPEGESVKECYFEYGTEADKYTNTVPCEQTPGEIEQRSKEDPGHPAVPVSAKLSGLPLADVRSFRLVAVSGQGVPADGGGLTISRPVTTGAAASDVGSVGASVGAEIDPEGMPTCYWLEYGTSASYGKRVPEGEGCIPIVAGASPVPVSAEIAGLQPDTAYHFRIVAKNALGSLGGEDVAFDTFPPSSAELPDHRVYELVSPAGAGHDTDVYVPEGMAKTLDPALGAVGATNHGVATERPFAAAAGGEAVTYVGDPPVTGGNGASGDTQGNQYVARRLPGGGWTQVDVNGSTFSNEYSAFSPDLSVGIVAGGQLAGEVPAGSLEIYSRATTAGEPFQPLSTAVPSCGGYIYDGHSSTFPAPFPGGNAGTGTVAAFSHLLFEASGVFPSTPEASVGCGAGNNLYDSVGGRLYLVNVLPDGEVDAHANFGRMGSHADGFKNPMVSHVISADGSRIYWSAVKTVPVGGEFEEQPQALYVRENDTQPQSPLEDGECLVPADACTVQVDEAEPGAGASGGGRFWTASGDGSKVFFTDENRLTRESTAGPDLYEYDLDAPAGERLSDLSLPVKSGVDANVQGVVGTSTDGSDVYFVAAGALTEGKNAEGQEPTPGQPNLYLRHDGVTTFVVTLAGGDDEFAEGEGINDGDWQADAGKRTAEVAPDGQSVVFMSRLPLTGYDSRLDGVHLTEVFVYDAQTGRIACASCNPSGEAPVAPVAPEYQDTTGELEGIWGSFLPVSESLAGYQPRVISEGGGRVFFDSIEPLVSRDSNGYLDVYEWEREGEGTCTAQASSRANGGCVFLLSGGQSPENSYLVDASSNGDDVFFVSRAQLVKADRGSGDDELYDARVGGVPEPEEESCAGTGCQGVPPAPPIFATPASATIAGVEAFEPPPPPPPPTVVRPKTKTVKCPKGKVRKHNKCIKAKKPKQAKKAKRASRDRGSKS